ncbi:Kdo hydroxylase family protein [Roseateles aquatilis]|uniref:Kdo hydroxylase family protein n=1 Tax=Roseateles aquatilis TaxID=431061 RepID=UPI00192CFAB1|nr:Kdo hydroxylase family protein [Roseateles aquatilis]
MTATSFSSSSPPRTEPASSPVLSDIVALPVDSWAGPLPDAVQDKATACLEGGHVLFMPALPFMLTGQERELLRPDLGGGGKNISYDPRNQRLRGCEADEATLALLQDVMARYAQHSLELLHRLLPHYRDGLRQARTSYRTAEIAGRQTSWRKDDTRLHVDSFPSSPTGGERILRVFSNVNPSGAGRLWRVGQPFDAVAERFLARVGRPFAGKHRLMQALHITKSLRSDYDHYMLGLHDGMKADLPYQASMTDGLFEFPAGSTWIVYTDQVSHAALKGQYVFEQTFHLPVESMARPAESPLRTLERLVARPLVG